MRNVRKSLDTTLSSRNVHYTKVDIAREHIQSLIMSGQAAPGARITTREISQSLGISDTPIREAIKMLAAEGWLEVQSHVGAVVKAVGIEQVREVSLLRGVVGELAIKLGRDRFTEDRFARIDANIEASQEIIERGAFNEFTAKNYEFHELICDRELTPWCALSLENLYGMLLMERHGLPLMPDRLIAVLGEHAEIRDHLKERDFDGAAELVRIHERRSGDFLIKQMREKRRNTGT